MGRVYIIRHAKPKSTWGESLDDDPGLDETGQAQARAAAAALLALPADFRPNSVVSSPLRRCLETALPFAKELGVEVEIDPRVGEVPTPAGLSATERSAWLKAAFAGRWDEMTGDLDYDAWRRDIVSAVAGRPGAAIFSHFVALNGVVSVLTDSPLVLAFRADHASISTFGLEDGRLSLLQLGREAVTGVL